jgi:hypothetical protein
MDNQHNPHLITDRSSRDVPFRTNADPRLARCPASYRRLCAEDAENYDSKVTALCEAVALEILYRKEGRETNDEPFNSPRMKRMN